MRSEKKPNVLLIVADDHGKDALGCYGNPVINTQNLDGLAADGVRFEQAFCTTASCAASRSVILTGNHNHTNGTYGHTHAYHHFSCFADVVTLPSLMNQAGYATACAGKKHYAPQSLFPFSYDFGDRPSARDDVAMAEECRSFISEASDPFFLYWCSHNPHRGGGVVDEHPCKPNRFGNPIESFEDDLEETYSDAEVLVPDFLTDNAETRAELAQYYQSVTRLDRGVGRLIELLKSSGKYEDTLIIYLSDNGAAFPAAKTTLYEPGMNLPCIVKPPNSALNGAVNTRLITWADVAPTIMDFAGHAEAATNMFGDTFRHIIDPAIESEWRGEVFASHTFHEITNYYPMRVVRTDRHKFIWNIAYPLTYSFASDLWSSATWQSVVNAPDGMLGKRPVDGYLHHSQFELYDLESDPSELHNLAVDPDYEELVDQMCAKVKEYQRATGDPWLHKWDYE